MNDNLKIIELHSHLEGTITAKTLIELARNGREQLLPTMDEHELHSILTLPGHEAFLNYFKITNPFRTTIADIQKITIAEMERAVANNVIYAEYRFNPMGPASRGTNPRGIIHTIREIMTTYEKRYGLKLSLLFGLAREEGPDRIQAGLDMAHEAWQEGIIAGIDLNGDEKNIPIRHFIKPFTRINKTDCPITIHAGEWASPESIKAAIDCGAMRIGHGARVVEDKDLMQRLKQESITLELCPTSNISTGVFEKIEEHPVKRIYDYGIPITVNSDDPAAFNSDISHEYSKTIEIFNFSQSDIDIINNNAIAASFLSDSAKEHLSRNLLSETDSQGTAFY